MPRHHGKFVSYLRVSTKRQVSTRLFSLAVLIGPAEVIPLTLAG